MTDALLNAVQMIAKLSKVVNYILASLLPHFASPPKSERSRLRCEVGTARPFRNVLLAIVCQIRDYCSGVKFSITLQKDNESF